MALAHPERRVFCVGSFPQEERKHCDQQRDHDRGRGNRWRSGPAGRRGAQRGARAPARGHA